MAKSISNFFRTKENKKVIEKLERSGVRTEEKTTLVKGKGLEGKAFVVTGSLKAFSRQAAEELIRRHGGNASSSVSKRTDFLVLGKDPGSKLEKAKKLGVKIIDEQEFRKMVK